MTAVRMRVGLVAGTTESSSAPIHWPVSKAASENLLLASAYNAETSKPEPRGRQTGRGAVFHRRRLQPVSRPWRGTVRLYWRMPAVRRVAVASGSQEGVEVMTQSRIQVVQEGDTFRLYRHFGEAPGPFQTIGEDIEVQTLNYHGFTFADFYASRDDHMAPGWFVFGRDSTKYGKMPDGRGAYIMLCARPAVKPRHSRNYNGQVRRGWATKREADAVAAELNRAFPAAKQSRERGL
jgi:hypothetical protein